MGPHLHRRQIEAHAAASALHPGHGMARHGPGHGREIVGQAYGPRGQGFGRLIAA